MAALNIAFDAPDNSFFSSPSRSRPIDLVHLAHQTMGDKVVELDVLQIFARQSRQIMKDLQSGDAMARQAAAHRLKGAAAAIGAFRVADIAQALETDPDNADQLSELASAVLDSELFILKLCR